VELSILDAFGRLFGEPVSTVTKAVGEAASFNNSGRALAGPPTKSIIKSPVSNNVRYSAVIDSGSIKLRRKVLVRRLYGFQQCKVKVGEAGDNDAARLRTIRRWIGPDMDLRIDANEAWRPSELRNKVEPLAEFGISCLEQPVPHAQVSQLAELRSQIGIPVMLDESLTSSIDAAAAIAGKTCDLFNIRLSKCGGFLASLRLAAQAHSAELGYQLGCHPGESGILSAAGRHWACSVGGIRYLEGSYDRHQFRRLLTNEDVTFGYGGRAPALSRPGLGVTINEAVLKELLVSEQSFSVA
jgi:muconate cycloisomerase